MIRSDTDETKANTPDDAGDYHPRIEEPVEIEKQRIKEGKDKGIQDQRDKKSNRRCRVMETLEHKEYRKKKQKKNTGTQQQSQ